MRQISKFLRNRCEFNELGCHLNLNKGLGMGESRDWSPVQLMAREVISTLKSSSEMVYCISNELLKPGGDKMARELSTVLAAILHFGLIPCGLLIS